MIASVEFYERDSTYPISGCDYYPYAASTAIGWYEVFIFCEPEIKEMPPIPKAPAEKFPREMRRTCGYRRFLRSASYPKPLPRARSRC